MGGEQTKRTRIVNLKKHLLKIKNSSDYEHKKEIIIKTFAFNEGLSINKVKEYVKEIEEMEQIIEEINNGS